MAFAGDVLVAGSYHGFNVYKLGEDGLPQLLSSVVCPGGQGDVSIVGELLAITRRPALTVNPGGIREGVLAHLSDNGFRW